MVGGHTHPDTPYSSLSVAVLGKVKRGCEIKSNTALAGDDVIAAYDLDGKLGPTSPYSWEGISRKNPDKIKRMYYSMKNIGEKRIVRSGKDISNPGIIGTLGMLCEASGVGAVVDIEQIPKPDEIPLSQWLLIHPSTGFIVTTPPQNTEEVISIFERSGLSASKIGKIKQKCSVSIRMHGREVEVFNLKKESITGIRG